VIAVAHARGLIDQHDDLARSAGSGQRRRRAFGQERPRERRHEQGNRRCAHQQQEPVADPTALHRLIRDLLHEHQRRELDDAFPLALNQVHDDRHRDGGETHEKQRS